MSRLLSSSSVLVVLVMLGVVQRQSHRQQHHPLLGEAPGVLQLQPDTPKLAPQINRQETITILALDKAATATLLGRHLPLATLKNLISFHILLDYFGPKKLHQITNGRATGFVNITDLKGGWVGFGAKDNSGVLDAHYAASLAETPYNIFVIQMSHPISLPEAEAPTEQNLSTILLKQGVQALPRSAQGDRRIGCVPVQNHLWAHRLLPHGRRR